MAHRCNGYMVVGLIMVIFFAMFLLPVRPVGAEGFKVAAGIGSSSPETYFSEPPYRIPEAGFEVGLFRYVNAQADEVPLSGFLIKDTFFYIKEDASSCFGDINYGMDGRYFVVDGFAYGASHNRTMHLLEHTRDSIRLLDSINQPYVDRIPMDFMTARQGAQPYGFVDEGVSSPNWTDVKDMDGDGRPEIRVGISACDDCDLDFPHFELYFEIDKDRLKVDLNPVLYMPLYDKLRIEETGTSRKPAYYVYGFLAGELSLEEIKTESAGDEKLLYFARLLQRSGKWDKAFHDSLREKPELRLYNAQKRR